MSRRFVAAVAGALAGVLASAAPPTGAAGPGAAGLAPEDFARARLLYPANGDAVQRVVIPADVYEWTARADLGDIRVFDSAGEALPYAVRAPRPRTGFSAWRDVPVFTLPPPGDDGRPAAVDIRLGDTGAVVAVHGTASTSAARAAYLIDVSGVAEPFSQLALQWPTGWSDFVTRVRLEASDDLDRWQVLSAAATVAQLAEGGERISVNELEFPAARPRYLRLSQLDGASALTLTRAEVRSREPGPTQRHWQALTGVPDGDGYRFDTGGGQPVDLVRVSVPQPTYLLHARVFSRADPAQPWRLRGEQRFYRVSLPATGEQRVERDGPGGGPAAVLSDGMAVPGPAHRHWRVEWVTPQAAQPTLEVGWRPHDLLFVQQGRPPFRLAYGRAGIDAEAWPIDELAERLGAGASLEALPEAAVGEVETLGGAARLQPAPAAIDWTTWTLWGVLLVGVAMVAALALRLIRSGAG